MRGNTIEMELHRDQLNKSDLSLFQYDYGQRLILTGVTLPESYEVHFANAEDGNSKTSVGDGTGVDVPDEFLLTGDTVYVWLFLHDGEDDGETEYKGIIPVYKRARPSDTPPTPAQQSVITQAIAALNAAVEQCEADVEKYPKIVDGYWYVWDAEAEEWVNTGTKAQGDLSADDIATTVQTQAMIDDYYGGGN